MIAEFINTLTNVLFMWLGIKGIHNCLAQGWDRVYLVSFLGYLTVGTGSFLFHASLKCKFTPRPADDIGRSPDFTARIIETRGV